MAQKSKAYKAAAAKIDADKSYTAIEAVALARENDIPIVVFSIREKGNLARVLSDEKIGTLVKL